MSHWQKNCNFFSLVALGLCLLCSGCAMYTELSPRWQHQALTRGGLSHFDIRFADSNPLRLAPDTPMLVAYAANGFEHMSLVAQAQRQALQQYFLCVHAASEGMVPTAAFAEARQQGAAVLMYLQAPVWKRVSPFSGDCEVNGTACRGGFRYPLIQGQLVFWFFDVQTESLLQSGQVVWRGLSLRDGEAAWQRYLTVPMQTLAKRLSASSS